MDYQEILAKCYIALCEVDYDLAQWEKSVGELA